MTKERWNFGGSGEFGNLFDSQTGAETKRKAAGIHMGYGLDKIQFSSAVEFRRDDAEQPDLTHTVQTVLLLRNNFKYQLTPSWRLLGKLDHSISNSSLGDFYTGGYTEGVVGYAYRPVRNDRLNALVKYTYFYNVPTTDQLGVAEYRDRVPSEEPHRVTRSYLRPHSQLVRGRQVRIPAGRGEPGPRAADFLRQYRAAQRVARGLAVPQAMGHPGRGATAWPPGSKSTPAAAS